MAEELIGKADHLSLAYKTKYSEDRTLKDMLSRPKGFVEGAIEGIINLLRQKAWRDGYIAGATENGTQWHDLRKDPSDLPKKVGNYIVCYLDTMLERHSFELSYVDYLVDRHWIDEDNREIETYDEGVIAWCEEPQFNSEV